MSDASAPPPPTYGAAVGNPYPPQQPSQQAPVMTEPPPKYEAPKDGPYAQQPYCQQPPPAGYPTAQGTYPAVVPGTQQGGFVNQSPWYQGQQATVHNTIIVTQQGFTAFPKQMECPNCRAYITTAISHQSGGLTWLSAGLLCLFGCWMGCCLIPFCIDDLQDVEHRCPNCGRNLGTYRRI